MTSTFDRDEKPRRGRLGLPRRRRASGRKKGMHPVAIALIVLAATIFVIYYAFNEGLPFQHSYTAHAVVENAVFVQPNDPVRIAGVTVGEVTGTQPYGSGATEITFTLDGSGQPIHTDATIRIRPRVFLEGAYYLDLQPGSPSAPVLEDGGLIPLARSRSYVQFYNLLSTFDNPSRNSLKVILGQLTKGFGPYYANTGAGGTPAPDSGATGLKVALPELTPTLKDFAWVARGLQGTAPNDVEHLLTSASGVTRTLAASTTQLADLVTSLNLTSAALASGDGALARSVSGLDQTLRVAPAALTAIDRSLPPLVNLGRALDPSLKVAPPLLTNLTSAVGELATIVAPVERAKLLKTLGATFEQLPTVLTQLGKLFPVTQGVTSCLRTHVTPVLNETVPDGSLSTGQPAWQEFAHLLTNVTSSDQNFDANNYWIRVLLAAGENGLEVGKLPLLGQLLGSGPTSSSGVTGARPVWVGDLKPTAFQPGVSCASQPVPSLSSSTAAPDFRRTSLSATPSVSGLARLERAIARAAGGHR
jgi:ABC-type transporter Mla subunit MlaD